MKRLLYMLFIFNLAAACRGPRSAAQRTDKLIFSHDFHAKLDFDCDTCHTDVAKSADLRISLIPKEAKCLECHAEHKEQNDCAFCHADPAHAGQLAPRARAEIQVSHAAHVTAGAPCAKCHPTLPESDKPAPPRPTMELCTSCHEHERDYAEARCRTCHPDLARFPIKPIATFSHQGRFLDEHAAVARTSAATCAQCHDQTFCADCHAKTVSMRVELRFPEDVERAFVHRGDFVSRHAADAEAQPETCARCHGSSFCESCHKLNDLTPSPEVASPRNPHPPGWSFPGNGQFHGDAARRDILSCAGCHDQGAASVCVKCHRTGGIGGNPHPPGWTDRHGPAEMRSNSMCLVCH